jgi:hypothetical protein
LGEGGRGFQEGGEELLVIGLGCVRVHAGTVPGSVLACKRVRARIDTKQRTNRVTAGLALSKSRVKKMGFTTEHTKTRRKAGSQEMTFG